MMSIDILKILFSRDLNRLKTEVEQYTDESDIWKVKGQITNSAGNLCLHLVGNLNTYIGGELGNTGYVRDRALEFSAKDVPRQELILMIDRAIDMVSQTLDRLDQEMLKDEYPILVFEEKTSTEYLLTHLTTHLTYHLGQINYHRRLIESG
jgi:uncharacterized damage-inducible protein DinB